MTEQSGKLLVRVVIVAMLLQLIFIGYVFWQSYEGRVHLVNAQRASCERGKKDRKANAEGWRIAQKARIAEGNFIVAKHYGEIAEGLEMRSRIPCSVAFPDAELIP